MPVYSPAYGLSGAIGGELDRYDLIRRDTHFRETSRGGLLISKVDVYTISRDRELLRRLTRIAAMRGFTFELKAGSLLMLPFERVSHPAVLMNPRRRRTTTSRRRRN